MRGDVQRLRQLGVSTSAISKIISRMLTGCIKNPINPHHCEIRCSDYFHVKEYNNMPFQILFSIVVPYAKIYKVYYELSNLIAIIKV